ncbi:branched-chain amino acid ABC transporter permease [Blastococcus sp. TF02-09]|uniref:branched-chain amino acid ABC transporter permease n=1 Tax=Blastococcus sp. TF02-09 TaxID=2250576 RepID=UPI000DE8099E|nr:branched-chain amino acid ABC transporter permease [Blastococcus sp. TF02-9]RBY79162.1 branched-chain amino acid ABC transporter permease [Blastococcus sp. TF02-9]
MSFLIDNFVELTVTGLVLGAVYGLVALGYTLVYGVLQLINFAHSEVWMFGSFAAVWVTVALGVAPGSALPIVIGVLLLALLAAMAVSGGVALLLERVAYRRLIRLDAPKLVALISAIGASFALAEFMGLRDRIADFFGLRDTLDPYVRSARDNTRFQNPLQTEGVFTVGGYTVSNVDIIIIVSAILMMVALDQFIRRTRTGRGIRAVAQDSEAAALMGVNRNRIIRATFLVGGIMAGAAALLYLMRFGVTRWNAGFLLGVKAFTAAVLGGIGNIRGALLGGFVLGLAENYGSALIGSEWRDVVAFLLLVVILLFRPTGLLGESLGRARA